MSHAFHSPEKLRKINPYRDKNPVVTGPLKIPGRG